MFFQKLTPTIAPGSVHNPPCLKISILRWSMGYKSSKVYYGIVGASFFGLGFHFSQCSHFSKITAKSQ